MLGIPDGSGAYIAKELPGPSNWTQWLAAWRVFQAAAIMLDILPLASLQLYERHFERLVRLYPSAWHLIVMADEKATGEKWARMRLRITSDIAAGRPPPDRWDKDRPWIASLHLLVLGQHVLGRAGGIPSQCMDCTRRARRARRAADCSPGEPCKAQVKRVHKCRICLSPGHRSQDCPQRA